MQLKHLVSLLTLGMTLTAIPAAPSFALENLTPNLYQLHGDHLDINYSTSSFNGKSRLDYRDDQQTLHFEGDQIRTTELEIGTLVTVTVHVTVDTGSASFSLLVPHVNLGQNYQGKIATEGITTLHRFSVVPRFNQGQTESYTVSHLTGTAKFVEFTR